MNKIFTTILLLSLSSFPAFAAKTTGISFYHHDWELACDNTRTCRAVGYHSEDAADGYRVSVLFTRKAGAKQPVTGSLMLGEYEDEFFKTLPTKFDLTMRVNGKNIGKLTIKQDSLIVDLSENQVAALLAALTQDSKIEWVYGKHVWALSDKGAAAVLLKMDDFQGRVGTVGALMRKGSKDESAVLPALPAPVIKRAKLPATLASDQASVDKQSKQLKQALLPTLSEENSCEFPDNEPFSVLRLSSTKLAVSALCWRAVYNEGFGVWVINDKPPYQPVLVTISASDVIDGEITLVQKGRGLGDCMHYQSWAWDGGKFALTGEHSTGMCRLMMPGGAWELPTFVSQ